MKAKISIMLLALVAVALVAVAPAAAVVGTVPAGGVALVGEEGLTLGAIPAGTTLEWFESGANPLTDTPAYTYITQAAGANVIDPSTFQTRTGNWYLAPNTGTVVMNVQMPSIDVKAYNAGTQEDMTNERVVKDSTYINFRVDSNLYTVVTQRALVAGDKTDIKIVVVDGEGTTYTALYNDVAPAVTTTGLTNLVPTTSQFNLPGAVIAGVPLQSNWALDRTDYKAGVYTFYVQVNLNSLKDNLGTITGVTKSDVYTIELGKDDVKIEANKDTVVRNNDFSVTITGRPNEYYVLWVKGTSSITAPDTAPYIKPNQNSVYDPTSVEGTNAGIYQFRAGQAVAADVCAIGANDYYAMVKLASSGTRTVGFGTDETTKDQTYTIRTDYYPLDASVPQPAVVANNPTYDTVKVKVEAGDVTITASGDSSYYIGEEIVISGTNTDSDFTWVFITGPNLPNKGGSIEDPRVGVNTAVVTSIFYPDGTLDTVPVTAWTGENVETDDTWEYKWDTAGVNLDAGTYTIYAVTTATNKDDLGTADATYGTASIVIKKPFVTATTSSATVAKGDDMYITGNAEGDPTQGIAVWILGKNYALQTTETVEDNGAFEYKFSNTANLAAGQYFVVVQHPMYNDQFDLAPQAGNPAGGQTAVVRPILDAQLIDPITGNFPPVFILEGTGSLQGSDAATALVNAMDSPDIDDTYYKLTFMVEEPWIMIDAIGDKYVGETFSITGTTNLAVGDQLIVEATSSSFKPTEKTQAGGFSGASGTVLVTAGDKDGVNVWEFAVDASTFTPDEYIVTVEGVEAQQTATQTFNVLKAEPTAEPTATPVETAQPTATPVPTAEPTPESTATPGFGVLVALIGLGAVAALIVRKD
ncbi:MEMAR_RS02690 family S-layer glycoprotein [Methanogenium organophilum]|uniref:DUF3821 domain-containing protein n=1 Tax=Methanogenium organophilum TaxID=2199 RepID=A0A9X9S5M6_METOG|nr:MEMAR_RS02690 family S-layer glycoprotein [Methanogenium organophilum]WAI01905.1 DUF3821 domain-containing protein [Methanogenium organophilum]